MMTEFQFVCLSSQCKTHNLVSEAYAQYRFFPDHFFGNVHSIGNRLGVSRSVARSTTLQLVVSKDSFTQFARPLADYRRGHKKVIFQGYSDLYLNALRHISLPDFKVVCNMLNLKTRKVQGVAP